MPRTAWVGAIGALLGFGAGVAVASVWFGGGGRGETARAIDPDRVRGAQVTAPGEAGPGGARVADRATRLALAAASLERAANSPRLQPAPAPPRVPAGDVVVGREEKVTLEQLPAPLRAVVAQIAQGRPIQQLTLERRIREGKPLFETEFELDGAEHELKLDEAGKILESEVDFAIGDLPAAITSGITASFPGAVLLDAEREQIGESPAFFEVNVRHQGDRYELQIAEDGRLLRTRAR